MKFATKRDAEWYLNSGNLVVLDLSYRAWSLLMRSGIDSVEKLEKMSRDDLMKIKKMGPKTEEEIWEALKRYKGENSDERI